MPLPLSLTKRMPISDEQLIAFLLDDASPALCQQIEEQLACDQELAERLTHFRFILGQMDSLAGTYEPPSDLVESIWPRIKRK